MKCIGAFFSILLLSSAVTAQDPVSPTVPVSAPPETSTPAEAARPSDAAAPANGSTLQPAGRLGAEDMIALSVYDSPELSRNIRIDADGDIRLPMVRKRIRANGLFPAELEAAIAQTLVDEHILVNPIVTVSVVEYHSRPITVIGAVKNPTTFQAGGSVTLLEAIVRAGGLTESAGPEILITHPSTLPNGRSAVLMERVTVRSMLDISDPISSLKLEGGENIRVPDAGRVFVVGNVKHPGPVAITEGSATVMKAVVLTGGLDSFTSKTAYIYRVEATGSSNQIPIEIKKIMTMKAPDVPLLGNDTLYVPNATGQRISAKALSLTLGVGLGIAGLIIYLTR